MGELIERFLDSLPMREYAERGDDPSFWAEPLNAFSALLFLVAVVIANRDRRERALRSAGLSAMLILGAVHAAGSFAYHSARSPVTLLFDFIPMTSFVAVAIIFALRHVSRSWLVAIGLVAGLIGVHVVMAFTVPKDFLNGSYRHGLNVTALVSVLVWIRRSPYASCSWLFVATIATYGVGVVFRSIDNAVADSFPWGTHFLWHTFTAVASYLALRLVMEMQVIDRTVTRQIQSRVS